MKSSSILIGVSALVLVLAGFGAYLAAAVRNAGRVWMRRGLGFASGFMLSFALLEILPEALDLTPYAHFMAVAGFAVLYVIEHAFGTHFCPSAHEDCAGHDHAVEPVGLAMFLGITVHSVIDGIAIGAALATSVQMGVLVSAAVVFHKVPDGFCLGTLLESKDYPRRPSNILLALFCAATPVGAILAYVGLQLGGRVDLGLALGLAAGSFLYVATADMLPETHSVGRREPSVIASVLVGIAVGSASLLLG